MGSAAELLWLGSFWHMHSKEKLQQLLLFHSISFLVSPLLWHSALSYSSNVASPDYHLLLFQPLKSWITLLIPVTTKETDQGPHPPPSPQSQKVYSIL